MVKPIVFFSHSAKDALPLERLKQRFVELTHDTLEVFLSTDGQSIRYGTNWLTRLEEALSKAQLMFLFITPNSVSSAWVYFEAGHAYAKGIDVVPVGLFGVDVRSIQPLTVLQGFNVKEFDGLNNLIAKVNEVFGVGHHRDFTLEDFRALETSGAAESRRVLGDHAVAIQGIRLHCRALTLSSEQINDLYVGVPGPTHPHDASCSIAGAALTLHKYQSPFDEQLEFHDLVAELDPLLSHETLPIAEAVFEKLLPQVGDDATHGYRLFIDFQPRILACDPRSFSLMARLRGTGAELAPDLKDGSTLARFRWKGLHFTMTYAGNVDPTYPLLVVERTTNFSDADLGGLVNLLFDCGVLAYKPGI